MVRSFPGLLLAQATGGQIGKDISACVYHCTAETMHEGEDIRAHLDFLAWYNETHGCHDAWGTTERCFKNSDGTIIDDLMSRKSTINTGGSAPCT